MPGWLPWGGIGNGTKAGFVAGIFGALVVLVTGLIVGTLFAGLFGFLIAPGIGGILIITALYFAVIGLAGGAVGGLIGK